MISATVTVKIPNWAATKQLEIFGGCVRHMEDGIHEMIKVMKETVENDARVSHHELSESIDVAGFELTERTIRYDIGVGTDHALDFELGTSKHFVSYAEADQRIKDGCYPHIQPIYKNEKTVATHSGGKESNPHESTGYKSRKDKPIGYLAWGNGRHSIQKSVDATTGFVVRTIANGIRETLESGMGY